MGDTVLDPEAARRESDRRLRRLRARSNRWLWHFCLFLAVSVVALRGFDFLPPLPDGAWAFLGRPPPPRIVAFALVLYSFSAVVLALGRLATGAGSGGGLSHVAYLAAFYGFFHLGGELADNFWAVFAAGVTILGLTGYIDWSRAREAIQEELQRLAQLERLERLRPPPPKQ